MSKRMYIYPWSAEANGFWNIEMFEEWLNQTKPHGWETEDDKKFQRLLKLRDVSLREQLVDEFKQRLGVIEQLTNKESL